MNKSGRSAWCKTGELSEIEVNKKSNSDCVKDASGRILAQGKIAATRYDLDLWMKTLPGPWMAAMEAAGSGGCKAFFLDQKSHWLLRAVW
jgi:hypothetical protein